MGFMGGIVSHCIVSCVVDTMSITARFRIVFIMK